MQNRPSIRPTPAAASPIHPTRRRGKAALVTRRLEQEARGEAEERDERGAARRAERARAIELEVEIADVRDGIVGEDLVGAILAYTGTEGDIVDPRAVIEELHTRGALAAVVTELSLRLAG